MQAICISRGTLGGGRELAERLAQKLGCPCLSREELIERATEAGIQVGKLEMAMIKPRMFSERLAVQREHYLAFSTAHLCDRAVEGRLVYHGRTGHLLLPGIDHVLSVRVVADEEQRVARVARDLGLDPARARKYVREVDADRRRWARSMYGIGWEDSAHYAVVVNLQHMSVENAATALVGIAELPDFQMTPASRKAMLDLRLAAKARLALAQDGRTWDVPFKVRADDGVVTVTFLPRDARMGAYVPAVVGSVEGVREVRSTLAQTNILWVQERFDPGSVAYQEVVELATTWNAAVELVRLAPRAGAPGAGVEAGGASAAAAAEHGGIEEDGEETTAGDDGGLKRTLDRLAAEGRSGGGRVVYGEGRELVDALDRSASYSLVVVGELFPDQGHAARVRMTRELERFLSDSLTAPVVGTDELRAQYLFGRRDLARLAGFLAVVAAVYLLVFSNQEAVVRFLYGGWWGGGLLTKILVAVAVFLFVPVVAHSYGTVTRSLMKLIKME